MSNEYQMTVLAPVCPDCGADVTALLRPVGLDWRDEQEARLGANADAVQQHRAAAHPGLPKVGDVVVYYSAWRGLIIGNGPLTVNSIREKDFHEFARSMGQTHLGVLPVTTYWLVDPSRPNSSRYALPSTGIPDHPITFEILTEYVPEPVETSLFDLLGDWEAA